MSEIIEKFDPNFRQPELRGGFRYTPLYDCPNVAVGGLFPGTFCRIDPEYLPKIPSEGVQGLAWHTAGATVRFRVPGGKFAFRVILRDGGDMSHMPRSGSSGVDVYFGTGASRIFFAGFRPNLAGDREFSGEVALPNGQEEVLLHLPLYNGVDQMELGFPEGITPEKPAPYRMEKPVLFYGSSITQGGCASRPGNCCSAMVSRLLDCMIWNLGFSGNAKGEAELAEYIANVPLGAMVYDYDHNAPSADHLERTHLPFLRTILEKQPELPVVIVSRPDYANFFADQADNDRRREIILRTYLWAKEQGYRVEFVDGSGLFRGPFARDCTVDGCHPNDLGFAFMAEGIAPLLKRIME